MINKVLWSLSMFLVLHLNTVAQGIQFQNGSWKDIVALAKKENKLIFMDIFTEWCGPCKKMSSEIFTLKDVGDYYNKNFINYKIDAEKGEGLILAQQYNVQAYPTLIFINPKDESIITKNLGGVDAALLIEKGNIALQELKDPMKWEDYITAIKNKKYDKNLIVKALEKAERTNQNNDAILDIYVKEFADTNFNEADIQFIVNHTKTMDNIAVDFIANKLNFQQREAFMEEFTTELYMGTYEKAVEHKNPKILEHIKNNKYQLNSSQTIPTHFYYLEKYYNALGDTTNYWITVEKEVNYYIQKALKDYKTDDSLAFEEIKQNYKKQLVLYGVPEAQHEITIQDALTQNPQAKISVSYMSAMQINEHITNLLMQKSKDKQWMQKALTWGEKMIALMDDYPEYKSYFQISNAYVLVANGKKDQAINNITQSINTTTNEELKASLKETLEQLQ